MDIVWDPSKAESNVAKHGVSFADAESVLFDPYAVTIEDSRIANEDRYVTIGMDALGRIFVVVYEIQEETLRIISARAATPGETKTYEAGI